MTLLQIALTHEQVEDLKAMLEHEQIDMETSPDTDWGDCPATAQLVLDAVNLILSLE